jgi:predicted dehydrogenase
VKKVRWGIIGAGRIAHSFANDIAATSNAELAAVAARSGDRARSFAAKYQIPDAHEGYAPLYENPQVDAVYVATPHSFHLRNCQQAMQAGKAVLCEKPLVLNPDECLALLRAAQDSGRYLTEGMWTWYLPAIRKAQQWVAAGRIGEIQHVKADFGYPLQYSTDLREYDARVGGGCVLEMGIYPIAIARLFLPGKPGKIKAVGRTAANGVEDDVSIILDYGHALATLGTSFRCKLQNWAYIIGTQGYIAIPDFWRADQCSLYYLDERIDSFEEQRETFGLNYQIQQVSADILAGRKQSEVVPLATSLALQEDMLAIRRLASPQ